MTRRLYRSRTDVVWTGVAGGVAQWLNVDPSIVRVAWVILTFPTAGMAALLYLVMWLVVPVEPAPAATAAPGAAPATPDAAATPAAATTIAAYQRGPVAGSLIVGLGLVVLGGYFLIREYLPEIDWDYVWPVALVMAGAALLLNAARTRR
jgi:phage shock protein C